MTSYLIPIRKFALLQYRVLAEGLALPGQRWRFLLLAFASSVAGFCEGGGILVISKLAHTISATTVGSSGDVTLPVPALDDVLRTVSGWLGVHVSSALIYSAVVLTCILFYTASGLHFIASKLSREMARKSHEAMVARLLFASTQSSNVQQLTNLEGIGPLRTSVMQHTVHTSKSLEALARLFQAVLFTLIFSTMAFVLDWHLMLILSISAISFAPVAMFVSRRIHQSAGDFFANGSKSMGTFVAGFLKRYESIVLPIQSAVSRDNLETSDANRFFDGFDDVQLAQARMALLTGLVRTTLFGIGLILMATVIMHANAPISRLVAFASALLMAFRYLQNCFSDLASLNIHYPQVVAFFAMSDALASNPKVDGPARIATRKFRYNPPGSNAPAADSPRVFELPPGAVVDLVCRTPLSRYDASRWLAPLVSSSDEPFQSGDVAMFGGDNLEGAEFPSRDAIDERLQVRGFASLNQLSTKIGIASQSEPFAYVLNPVSPATGLMAIAAALSAGATEIFIDVRLLRPLVQAARLPLSAILGPARLYVHRRPQETLDFPADLQIILSGSRVTGMSYEPVDSITLERLCPARPADVKNQIDDDQSDLL